MLLIFEGFAYHLADCLQLSRPVVNSVDGLVDAGQFLHKSRYIKENLTVTELLNQGLLLVQRVKIVGA